tara:strand:+ start:216 stop:1160 length:945 start_codon:yes stop_codon:yes gene_type:complete
MKHIKAEHLECTPGTSALVKRGLRLRKLKNSKLDITKKGKETMVSKVIFKGFDFIYEISISDLIKIQNILDQHEATFSSSTLDTSSIDAIIHDHLLTRMVHNTKQDLIKEQDYLIKEEKIRQRQEDYARREKKRNQRRQQRLEEERVQMEQQRQFEQQRRQQYREQQEHHRGQNRQQRGSFNGGPDIDDFMNHFFFGMYGCHMPGKGGMGGMGGGMGGGSSNRYFDDEEDWRYERSKANRQEEAENQRVLEEKHANILGVSGDATRAEIKTAYRKQALMYHPDKWSYERTGMTKEQGIEYFKQINEANEFLTMS